MTFKAPDGGIRFWLSVAGFLVMLGMQVAIILTHVNDGNLHLALKEKSAIQDVVTRGFTFSQKEKAEMESRVKNLEKWRDSMSDEFIEDVIRKTVKELRK